MGLSDKILSLDAEIKISIRYKTPNIVGSSFTKCFYFRVTVGGRQRGLDKKTENINKV